MDVTLQIISTGPLSTYTLDKLTMQLCDYQREIELYLCCF